VETEFGGKSTACLVIGGVDVPIVFEKPGTYQIGGTNQQKSAFGQGTVYFRHGAKSEPGTTDDLRRFVDREIERLRSAWLDNIRKVVEAPTGSKVIVVPVERASTDQDQARCVRLTTSLEAPLVRELDPNTTHPYRQKEVAQRTTEKLGQGRAVTPHDVFAIRKAHGIDQQPHYCYHPTFSTPLYSESFVDWIVSECGKNPEFVELARRYIRALGGGQKLPLSTDERLQWLVAFMQKHGHTQAAVARMLRLNSSTVSLLIRGSYGGNVEGILHRIEDLRRSQE
jgi:hypothetical protein